MLQRVDTARKILEFEVTVFKEQKGVFILGGSDEIITSLGDSLVTVSTIMGSRFVTGIKE